MKASLSFLILLISCILASCAGKNKPPASLEEEALKTVVKKRDDGTISSVNQVDPWGMVHGVRVTYYDDGTSIYSRITFNHGKKQGPAIFYYKNGQVFKHTGFLLGKHHGPSRKYYKNGKLMAEFAYEEGMILPGLKEYRMDGSMVKEYPELAFREIDLRRERKRIDLEISCPLRSSRIVYYIIRAKDDGSPDYILLENKNGNATIPTYIRPGAPIRETIRIRAELPTKLGNVYVRDYTYILGSGLSNSD